MNDKELALGIKKGNAAAFRQLFLKYYTIICRFLERFVNSGESASDLAQDIFMRLWINRHRIDPEKSIKSYLYTSAKNEAINHLKQSARFVEESSCGEIQDGTNPEKRVEYFELRTALENKIEAMPAQRKLIFRMSRYNLMSNKEIADELGLSVRTVEKHLELARKDIESIKPA